MIFNMTSCLKKQPAKALRSGIMIRINFIGVSLIVGLKLDNLDPTADPMAKCFGVQLGAVDVGWPSGSSRIICASQIGGTVILIATEVKLPLCLYRD
ncbi:PTS transporter subunit IIC [Priestia megaterium]|uniref:PTS transporter subunit IIC n=1 Tax=Priestia megaterium TaxID=1404 RepID=UPI003AF2E7E1